MKHHGLINLEDEDDSFETSATTYTATQIHIHKDQCLSKIVYFYCERNIVTKQAVSADCRDMLRHTWSLLSCEWLDFYRGEKEGRGMPASWKRF
jgi:hypothetical protein